MTFFCVRTFSIFSAITSIYVVVIIITIVLILFDINKWDDKYSVMFIFGGFFFDNEIL